MRQAYLQLPTQIFIEPKNYCVLIFDNRGAGQTVDNGEPFSVQTMADDTIALMKALEISQAFIVGHSLGGAIVQTIAKNYQDKVYKIILSNSFIKFNQSARLAFSQVINLYKFPQILLIILLILLMVIFMPETGLMIDHVN